MPTDDERREVAHNIRENYICGGLGYRMASAYNIAMSIGMNPGFLVGDIDLWCRLADLIEPQPITGDTSDGYHTFNELYDHRAKLFSVIVRCFKGRAWKSKLHHDGTMYEGMFIVGIETSQGQATYHYDIDPYWNAFDCKELARAPEWDVHTPEQAIFRIASLRPSCDRDALLALASGLEADADRIIRAARNARFGGGPRMGEAKHDACEWRSIARRIREACGEAEHGR